MTQTNTNNDINNGDSMINKHLSRHNYSTIFLPDIDYCTDVENGWITFHSLTIFGQGSIQLHLTGMTAQKLSIVFLAYSPKHACSRKCIVYSQLDCVILFIVSSNKAWMSILSWCVFLHCLFRGFWCTAPFFVFINDINIYCYSIMRTTKSATQTFCSVAARNQSVGKGTTLSIRSLYLC